jgi:large subunit ribosomal protein L10
MRAEKQLLLDEVKEKIDSSNGFVIASYKGMTAQKARAFRDTVASANGDFEIVRKRVFAKAAEKVGIKLDADVLKGHVGILFAKDDALAISKIAVKYGEENEQGLKILGGMIEGTYCSGEELEAMTKLPGINELRAQLLGLFEAPMAQTVGALDAALTSLLYCLDEKSKKEENA